MHSPVSQNTAIPLPAITIFSLQTDILKQPLEQGLHGLIYMNNPQEVEEK